MIQSREHLLSPFLALNLNGEEINQNQTVAILYDATMQQQGKLREAESEMLLQLFQQAFLLGKGQQNLVTRVTDLKAQKKQLCEHLKQKLMVTETIWLEKAKQISLKITQLYGRFRQLHLELVQESQLPQEFDCKEREILRNKPTNETWWKFRENFCRDFCQNNWIKFRELEGINLIFPYYNNNMEGHLSHLEELSCSAPQALEQIVKISFEKIGAEHQAVTKEHSNLELEEGSLPHVPANHSYLTLFNHFVQTHSPDNANLSHKVSQLDAKIAALTAEKNKLKKDEINQVMQLKIESYYYTKFYCLNHDFKEVLSSCKWRFRDFTKYLEDELAINQNQYLVALYNKVIEMCKKFSLLKAK